MSLGYSIIIETEKEYSDIAIKSIIEKGINYGFRYQKFILGSFNGDIPFLKENDAIKIAIDGDQENTMHALTIKIEDTFATLNFMNHEGKLGLMFHNFHYPWLKKFEDGDEDIDIGKYAKIMLDLVEDYKILEMKIGKD